MKILVTGAKGQLGSELRLLSTEYTYEFEFIDLEQLDLAQTNRIIPFLVKSVPDFIINCAAYTAVDRAEDEPDLAERMNSSAPKEIAKYCYEHDKRLIHISTDYVFDGNFTEPIKEDAVPNPQSVYGKTKLKGEQAINELLKDAYIIRTAWVYSAFGNNFVKTMLRLGVEKDEISVVSDQYGSPTFAGDLGKTIMKIIQEVDKGNHNSGTYHYSNNGSCSWYDFAKEIFRIKNISCKVNPISTSYYPTKAIRPAFSVLCKDKIIENFNVAVPDWNLSLKHSLTER